MPRPSEKLTSPTVRLGLANSPAEREGNDSLCEPTVRRVGQFDGGANKSILPKAFTEDLSALPALLVSYWYLDKFLENKHRYHYRDWVMDSGAFSAHNSGVEIKIEEYVECCKNLLASDPTLTEVYALDVIGDEKASLKNVEYMWKHGVPAIPTFHYGGPWSSLLHLVKHYPKIAIGGCVGKRDKDKFASQCFARIWPKKIHGFGFGSEKSILLLPWHSVDATNWEIAPCKYGRWKAFGGQRVSVRGSQQNLRAEVEWYLDLERRARERWKKEMKLLEAEGPRQALALSGSHSKDKQAVLDPTVRLDNEPGSAGGKRSNAALAPTVRLAESGKALGQGERRKAKIQALSGRRLRNESDSIPIRRS